MSKYKNVMISSERILTVRHNQLFVDDDIDFPLEDINCIVIDNPSVAISAALFDRFSEYGIVVFFCNKQHLPSTVLLPMLRHSRHLAILRRQIEANKPIQKQIWQKIIKRKIENQGKCLEIARGIKPEELYDMSKSVKSGDSTHIESKAAAYYFRQLFGKNFSRGQDTVINASLNYGYAIIRGMIARTLVCYGFEPSIGIWHNSEQNQFNLADDLLEPFRPLVDLLVVLYIAPGAAEMNTEIKHKLFCVMNYDMSVEGELRIVRNCIELLVSDMSSMLSGKGDSLRMPELIPLAEHSYE